MQLDSHSLLIKGGDVAATDMSRLLCRSARQLSF